MRKIAATGAVLTVMLLSLLSLACEDQPHPIRATQEAKLKIYYEQQERRASVASLEDPEPRNTLRVIVILAGLGILGGLLYLIDSLVNLTFRLAGLISWIFSPPLDEKGRRIPWRIIWCTHPKNQLERDGDNLICGKCTMVTGEADPHCPQCGRPRGLASGEAVPEKCEACGTPYC